LNEETDKVIQQEQQRIRLLKYIRRYQAELKDIQDKLITGEVKIIDNAKKVREKGKGEMGKAPAATCTSPSSLVRDINSQRTLRYREKRMVGAPLKKENIPVLLPVDLENLKIRIFSSEFPADGVVKLYQKNPTLENRFNLLIHVASLENGLRPSDYMDLHGITMDWLMKRLKEFIDDSDKREASKFLRMAILLHSPEPKKLEVKKAEQTNIYNMTVPDGMTKEDLIERIFDSRDRPKVSNSEGEYVPADAS